jgi:hypothetical protein
VFGRGAYTYHEVEPKPTERAEDAPELSSYRRLVIFYAVVSDEIGQVIEFYNTHSEAEAMLERVLSDELDWRELLYIEPIELVTGWSELKEHHRAPRLLGRRHLLGTIADGGVTA